MTTPHLTITDGLCVWTVAPEDSVARADETQALVAARLIDEMTDAPLLVRPSVRPLGRDLTGSRIRRLLTPRIADAGVVGFAGTPRQVFPRLDTTGYEVGLTVEAPGFMRLDETAPFAPQVGYPATFVAAALGVLPMRRTPVVFAGRITHLVAGQVQGANGVQVRLDRFWARLPDAGGNVPGPRPVVTSAAAMPMGLYAERPAAAQLSRSDFNLGNTKQLARNSPAGVRRLRVSDSVGLGVGVIVVIDAGRESAEYIEVTAVTAGLTAADPADLTLRFPLARDHRPGGTVDVAQPTGPTPAQPLRWAARAGDVVVFLDALPALGVPPIVSLSGGAAPPEYHRAALFDVTSNADGYYRMPALGRAVQVRIVTNPAMATGPLIVSPVYGGAEHRVDLVVP